MVEKRKSISPLEVKRGGYLLKRARPSAIATKHEGLSVLKKRNRIGELPPPASSYKGVRMRVWGKWVTEIRDPVTKTRIWLGSFATAEMAARAYDAAVVCLKGPSAPEMNFPDSIPAFVVPRSGSVSPKEIQAVAFAAATASIPPAAPLAVAATAGANSRREFEVAECSTPVAMETYFGGENENGSAMAVPSNVENWIKEEFGELDADEESRDFYQKLLLQVTDAELTEPLNSQFAAVDDDALEDASVHHDVQLWSFS